MPNYARGSFWRVQVEDSPGSGTYVTIACGRSLSYSKNTEQIDTTSKCNMPQRQQIEGGMQAATISLSGVFSDNAGYQLLRDYARNGQIVGFKTESEFGDSYEGDFLVASLEESGEYNDAMAFDATIESAGEVSYSGIPAAGVTAKSVVFDVADNHGSAQRVGIRSIEFYSGGVLIPLEPADYTTYATTEIGAVYNKDNAFDTTLPKTGSAVNNEWQSANSNNSNQRLIVVFNTDQTFDEIIINNSHSSGTNTNFGADTVKVTYSPDEITDTVYNNPVSNGVELVDSQWLQHIAADVAEDQSIWELV